MNNIVANFEEILNSAKDYGLGPEKKRVVLREYLQSKIIALIYQEKISKNLFFVGGTSLRLLRGLNRFSEDLDFDAVRITPQEIQKLMMITTERLQRENIAVEFYYNKTPGKDFFELRFPNLLRQLGLSPDRKEKLMIKLDIESFWRGQERETVFFNRYGSLATVVTKTLEQVTVEKLAAYLRRGETQPRDLYDLVWLMSKGTKPDFNFAKKNRLPSDFLEKAEKKFTQEKKFLTSYKKRLQPFLLEENQAANLDFFPQLLRKII